MPSASLLRWQNDQMPRLGEVETQCVASLARAPAQPNLVEENLRGYVLLLSAHFQGFCHNLYAECAQIVASKVRVRLRGLFQSQITVHRRLSRGNPNLQNLKDDFGRFGFTLDLVAADSGNIGRLQDLALLNWWRNIAAHYGTVPAGTPPLTLPSVQTWRNSTNGLATSLDQIMYNELRRLLRRAPW